MLFPADRDGVSTSGTQRYPLSRAEREREGGVPALIDPAAANKAARAFAVGRMAIGATFALAPGFAGSNWLGVAPTPATRVFLRAMGGRDLALGAGTLAAGAASGETGRWLRAHAAAEATDAIAALLAAGHLPPARRALASVGPGVLAMVALALARGADRGGAPR